MRIIRSVVAVAAVVTLAASLSGCTSIVPMQAAADANNPDCADLTVRLPDRVGDLDRRETNAQATGAWGSPPAVLLYCGVEVPSASTQRCIQVEGIFWLVDASNEPTYVLRSFGREPAVDVVVDTEITGATPVLMSLSRVIGRMSTNGHACTDLDDAQIIDSDGGLGASPALPAG